MVWPFNKSDPQLGITSTITAVNVTEAGTQVTASFTDGTNLDSYTFLVESQDDIAGIIEVEAGIFGAQFAALETPVVAPEDVLGTTYHF